MPEMNESEVPTSQIKHKRNERTEAKFFEDANRIIAEGERLGGAYQPPNKIAEVSVMKAKRDAARAALTVNQASEAAEETERNSRENLYKPLNGDITSLVEYAKSARKPANDIAALKSIARSVKGQRAQAIDPDDGARHVSVAHLSYVSRADNYAEFIEQYDTLQIPTAEDFYKASTHRAKLAALETANQNVITAESNTSTSGEALDRLAYLDDDSLLNACISAKGYIKSKFKAAGQPYKNIAKTRFELPTRLRKKK